ncbi:MAG: Exosome complex component RRP42, partial [Paramarteilia canceri]
IDGSSIQNQQLLFSLKSSVLRKSYGSAHIITSHRTEILAGVQMEFFQPETEYFSQQGRISFSIELSKVAQSDLEAVPNLQNYTSQLISLLNSTFNNKDCVDLSALCIEPKKKCINLIVDILILQAQGDLAFPVSAVSKFALKDTKIAIDFDQGQESSINIKKTKLDSLWANNLPLFISCSLLNDKCLLCPPLPEKLSCQTCFLAAVSYKESQIVGLDVSNKGVFSWTDYAKATQVYFN